MKLISHRGNIYGPILERENAPDYIQEAIDKGYDVEIDVRLNTTGMFLGHDGPEHQIKLQWLLDRADSLWVHAKDFNSLDLLLTQGMRVFYHKLEKHTIIGNTQVIWSHDIAEANLRSIIPLIGARDVAVAMSGRFMSSEPLPYYGVCSDFIEQFKESL